MKIKANGEEVDLEGPITVAELLVQLKVEMPQYVTVQINEQFVEREEFTIRSISEGDEVEFLYYMGGGSR